MNVVASGLAEVRERSVVAADGSEHEEEVKRAPIIEDLQARILEILSREGKAVVALNANLFAAEVSERIARLKVEARQLEAERLITRFMWIKACAVALNPIPIADIAGGALSGLDCNIRWIDSRRGVFRDAPNNVRAVETGRPVVNVAVTGVSAAFDGRGWPYYSGEDFDLYYPGYGDSWPSFLGATGMTYETDGGGQKGVRWRRARWNAEEEAGSPMIGGGRADLQIPVGAHHMGPLDVRGPGHPWMFNTAFIEGGKESISHMILAVQVAEDCRPGNAPAGAKRECVSSPTIHGWYLQPSRYRTARTFEESRRLRCGGLWESSIWGCFAFRLAWTEGVRHIREMPR